MDLKNNIKINLKNVKKFFLHIKFELKKISKK